MSLATDPAPDLGRPDAATVLVTVVETGSAQGRTAAAQAVADHWLAAPWPEGLLSLTCFTSLEDHLLLLYAQWEPGATPHAAPADDASLSRATAGLADTVRIHPSVDYVVHRSTVADHTAAPAFFSVDAFRTTGREATHAWMDRALALEAEAGAHTAPGAVSGHLHVSGDGARMLNLSGWVSPAAHAEFLAGGALRQVFEALGSPGTPCVGSSGYRLHTSLTAPSAPR
ncbi:hypothetical protein AB0N07_41430 [Streptomyces sp. NPDC051172]|uniref:hypothetical protein n=1 Tax=Streptomyces sp. NPDC051172 TaxID=3155796 RepID=UPI003414621E